MAVRSLGWLLAGATVLALPAAPAMADVLHLKNGRTLEGKVLGEVAGAWRVKTRYGTQTVPKADVDKIVYGPTAWETYAEKRKAILPKKDAALHADLARWCETADLRDEAKAEWQTVVKLDPEHAQAREKLGFVKYDGRWVTPKEKERLEKAAQANLSEAEALARGMVKHEGRWVTPAERLDAEQKAKGLVKVGEEWLTAAEAETRRDAAEFGTPRDAGIESETLLGFRFVKRDTPDAVVASVDQPEDAKAIAALAIRIGRLVRSTLKPEQRDAPLPGEPFVIYSIPQGTAENDFLDRVCRPAGADGATCTAIAQAGAWNHLARPCFVYVRRRDGEAVCEGQNGSLLAHGIAHAYLYRLTRMPQDRIPAWLGEGFACWLDGQVMPTSESWCVDPGARPPFEKREEWALQLQNMVTAGQDPALAAIVDVADADGLKGAMCAKAAAVVGFVAAVGDGKFWDLLPAVCALGGAKGVETALGKDLATLEREWRATLKK